MTITSIWEKIDRLDERIEDHCVQKMLIVLLNLESLNSLNACNVFSECRKNFRFSGSSAEKYQSRSRCSKLTKRPSMGTNIKPRGLTTIGL